MEAQGVLKNDEQKDDFIKMVRLRDAYNREKRLIEDKIYEKRKGIKEAEETISQNANEIATSLFMRKARKEKLLSQIEDLKKKEEPLKIQEEGLKEKVKNLTLSIFKQQTPPPICFGAFSAEDGKEAEPIEWEVMLIRKERALLFSVFIIECMSYAEKLEDTSWNDSLIRKWLNGEFYNECFSEHEKKLIALTEISNPGNEAYKTPSSSNTRDKIFIPSVKEVQRFYGYDDERIASATSHAKDKGIFVDETTGGSYWWLRSNGGNMYNAAAVNFKGYVFEYGSYVNTKEYGIRPALWIELKKEGL